MLNKKFFLVLFVIVIVGFFFWKHFNRVNLTDEQIRSKFSCGRVTLDARETDYYCGNPDAYRQGKPVPGEFLFH